MKEQSFQNDLTIENYGFQETKDALLKATQSTGNDKHPIKRVKFKVTFYWE